jgi:DNA-binding LacI/PurR family transcriptional regulator
LAITIHDVARRAGVSVTTVSRALAEPQLVRDETRERVLAVAKQLAYHPNRAARSLITGKTGNIGIIVPDLDNPFYPSVLRGVQASAHQAGYAVLLADSGEDPAAERNLVHTMAKQIDGIILCAPFSSNQQLSRLAAATSMVLVNRRLPGIPAVLMNSARGMRQVVSHIVSLGHRRCAYLGGPRNAWSNRQRLRGLHTSAKSHALELLELGPFEPKFEGGIQGTELALKAGATVILAYNDLMALGVLSRLSTLGIKVPSDMSVVGFDDVLYAAMCAPPLTTVSMPMESAGRSAVSLLLGRLAGGSAKREKIEHVELDTELIVRATTGPPAGADQIIRRGRRELETRAGHDGMG